MLEIKRVEFDEVEDGWRRLEAAGHVATIFQTYDWLKIWWQHYGDGEKKKLILAFIENGDLVGIAPLFVQAITIKKLIRLFGVVRSIGARENSYSSLIISSKPQECLNVLPDYLRTNGLPTLMHLADIRESECAEVKGSLGNHLRTKVRKGFVSPQILFPGSWDSYWDTIGHSTRKNLRWYRNKLDRDGKLEVERESEYNPSSVNDLYKLHYGRWGMDSRDSTLKRLEDYEKDIMKMLARRGALVLYFLNYQGRRIAGMLTYDYAGTRYYHKGGYDLAYKDMSPGTVLLLETIRDAYDKGLKGYDFLRGDESYKQHFANTQCQSFEIIAAFSSLKLSIYRWLMHQ